MPRKTARLAGDTLHEAAITEECYRRPSVESKPTDGCRLTVSGVVNQVETITVVHRPEMGLRHRETDGIGDTLPKGAGGDLDTYRRI